MISYGHSWLDIKQYNLSEIGFFVRRHIKSRFEDQKAEVTKIWMGVHLNAKSIKELNREKKKVATTETDLSKIASAIQRLK